MTAGLLTDPVVFVLERRCVLSVAAEFKKGYRMNPLEIYRQNAITTQTPAQIVVLLHEGAVRFLKQAQQSLQRRDYAQKTYFIGRVQEIVFELNASLDMEAGKDISKNLRSLYAFIWTRLNEVCTRNNRELLDRIITILEDMAGAWKKISV
jgi:flagellar protein FliS